MTMAVKRKSVSASVKKKIKTKQDDLSGLAKAIISNAGVGIYIVQNGKFVYVSELYQKLTGYSEADLIGTYFLNNIHPDDKDMVKKEAIKCLKEERFEPYEYRFVNKNNEIMVILETIAPIVYKGKRATLGSCMDITERKEAEKLLKESEAQYRLMADHMKDHMWLMDLNLNITYIRPSVERLMGYSLDEIKKLQLDKLLTPESLQNAMNFFSIEMSKALAAPPDYILTRSLELEFLRKNGEPVWGEIKFSFIRDENGKPVSILGEGRDITERKRVEEKLQYPLESLKKAVGTTIRVLVSALKTRDPYTAVHQSRVADIACAIAGEMGLTKEIIEGIRMAGIIHDIGKLSVPGEILSKPTKLTNLEFSMIKEHSQSGYEMLKDVESPWPLADMVYQHHERMNGSGHPRHLKDDEILLGSRILAVADVVESMASHRPYRASLGIEKALAEIEKNKGILYDADVTDACLRLFREKGYQII